ncbi:hypothetical protein [Clostridium sp.]|uniref:hypothetical protein n=1 Tax=Clostridium sp. TaxID=1506 RepID=UPI001A45B4F6|nr:hypothetical protein [Clostridium sp.]MBK5234035.1 hypothetical protein [Clostridium sp.]
MKIVEHHITKYGLFDNKGTDDKFIVEAWTQLNIFGHDYCFNKRKVEITKGLYEHVVKELQDGREYLSKERGKAFFKTQNVYLDL